MFLKMEPNNTVVHPDDCLSPAIGNRDEQRNIFSLKFTI